MAFRASQPPTTYQAPVAAAAYQPQPAYYPTAPAQAYAPQPVAAPAYAPTHNAYAPTHTAPPPAPPPAVAPMRRVVALYSLPAQNPATQLSLTAGEHFTVHSKVDENW